MDSKPDGHLLWIDPEDAVAAVALFGGIRVRRQELFNSASLIASG